MNVSIARTLADANRQPAQVIRRGEESSTHLIYIDEWQRFVAMKIYRREFFADANVVRQFQDRVQDVQARYASGIAYPFFGGHENGRLFLLLQQFPGHHLADLIAHRGPLDPSTLFALGGLILTRLEFVHRHYGLSPSLEPSEVYIHRDGPHEWTIGFSDYDLRPLRQPWAYSPESKAVENLTLLLHYLRTGSWCPHFEELLPRASGSAPLPSHEPLDRLFERLLDPKAEARPRTFSEFLRLLEDTPSKPSVQPDLVQPPVSQSLLSWVPDSTSLTDRFQYGPPLATLDFPAVFNAWDVLAEHASRVYVLPSAGPDRPKLGAIVQQCVKLARQNDIPEFTAVDSVMSDPSCCLISELPPESLSLWDVLKRREFLSLSEAVKILELLASTVERLIRKGCSVPVLQPQNILLHSVTPTAKESWWEDLAQPESFRLSLRPFPTNLLFAEAPSLSEVGGKGPARARATRNYFDPRFASAALAHRIIRCAFRPNQDMPAPLAAVFHSVFSQASPAISFSSLTARLEKAARALQRSEGSDSRQEPGASKFPRPEFSFAKLSLPLPPYPKSKTAQTA